MAKAKAKPFVVRPRDVERAQLQTLCGGGHAPARTLTRARILLKANHGEVGPGWTDAAIAGALEVGRSTVARVRQRYVTQGLEAALWHKQPEREDRRKLDGAQEAPLVALACGEPPEGRPAARRWAGGTGSVMAASSAATIRSDAHFNLAMPQNTMKRP